jgi:hypothetical protein
MNWQTGHCEGPGGQCVGLGLNTTLWALVCTTQLFVGAVAASFALPPPPGLVLDVVCLIKDEDGISSIDLQATDPHVSAYPPLCHRTITRESVQSTPDRA